MALTGLGGWCPFGALTPCVPHPLGTPLATDARAARTKTYATNQRSDQRPSKSRAPFAPPHRHATGCRCPHRRTSGGCRRQNGDSAEADAEHRRAGRIVSGRVRRVGHEVVGVWPWPAQLPGAPAPSRAALRRTRRSRGELGAGGEGEKRRGVDEATRGGGGLGVGEQGKVSREGDTTMGLLLQSSSRQLQTATFME